MKARSEPAVGLRAVGLTQSETPSSMNSAENAGPCAERRMIVKLVSLQRGGPWRGEADLAAGRTLGHPHRATVAHRELGQHDQAFCRGPGEGEEVADRPVVPGGHAELGGPVVEGADAFEGICKSRGVVGVEHDDGVPGIGPPVQVGRRHRQVVQAETRPGRAGRAHGCSGQGNLNAAREHAVLPVPAASVVGTELAGERRAEGRRPGGGQVPVLAARPRLGDGDARQARCPAAEGDADRQYAMRLGAPEGGQVEQARIQPPAEVGQRVGRYLLPVRSEGEGHEAVRPARGPGRDRMAAAGQRAGVQNGAVDQQERARGCLRRPACCGRAARCCPRRGPGRSQRGKDQRGGSGDRDRAMPAGPTRVNAHVGSLNAAAGCHRGYILLCADAWRQDRVGSVLKECPSGNAFTSLIPGPGGRGPRAAGRVHDADSGAPRLGQMLARPPGSGTRSAMAPGTRRSGPRPYTDRSWSPRYVTC